MNDLDTLKSAERWTNEALQTTATDNPLIFLVGSKRDLIVCQGYASLNYVVYFRQIIKILRKLSREPESLLNVLMQNFGLFHH